MTTLTTFILDRIAEDEAIAKAAAWFDRGALAPTPVWTYAGDEVEPGVTCDHEGLSPAVNPEEGAHIALHDPARVLTECETKRRIIEQHVENESRVAAYRSPRWLDGMNDDDRLSWRKAEARYAATDSVIRALAQVYADHADYQPEWSLGD